MVHASESYCQVCIHERLRSFQPKGRSRHISCVVCPGISRSQQKSKIVWTSAIYIIQVLVYVTCNNSLLAILENCLDVASPIYLVLPCEVWWIVTGPKIFRPIAGRNGPKSNVRAPLQFPCANLLVYSSVLYPQPHCFCYLDQGQNLIEDCSPRIVSQGADGS